MNLYIPPKKVIQDEVRNVLITFGGTDPNNITEFVYNCLKDKNLNIEIIVGPGCENYELLKEKVDTNVKIFRSVKKNV